MAGLLPTLQLLAAAFRALTACVPISSFCKDTIVLIDWLSLRRHPRIQRSL